VVLSGADGVFSITSVNGAQSPQQAFAINLDVTDDQIVLATTNATGINFNSLNILSGGTIAGTTITGSGVLSTTDTTEASAIGTASVVTAGGLGVAFDMWIGDDIVMDSDSTVIFMGADQDILVTHVADTGINITTTANTSGTINIGNDDDGNDDSIDVVLHDSGIITLYDADDDTSASLSVADGESVFTMSNGLTLAGTLNLGAAALIDATGAVDLDIGSADVTDVTIITDGGADSLTIGNNADLDFGITFDSDTDDATINWDEANSEFEINAPNYVFGANADEDINIVLDSDTNNLTINWDEDNAELELTSEGDEDLVIDLDAATDNEVTLGTSTGVLTISTNINGIAIKAPMEVTAADADGETIATADLNTVRISSGAGDWSLPADSCDAATGNWLTVIANAAHVASIESLDTIDQFYLSDGTGIGANEELDTAGGAWDSCTVMCVATNTWLVVGERDTCADGGAKD
jgi:hypothetical protein